MMTTKSLAERHPVAAPVVSLAACFALVLFIGFALRPVVHPEDALAATAVKDLRMVLVSREPVEGWKCELLVYRDSVTDQTLHLVVCSGVGSVSMEVSK